MERTATPLRALVSPASAALDEGGLGAVIDGLDVGITVHDPDGRIVLANAFAQDLLGVRGPELVRRSSFDAAWDVVDERGVPVAPEDLPVSRVVRTGRPVRREVIGVRRGAAADRVWLLVTAEPELDDGRVRAVVCSFGDVTPQRLAAERLREQNVELAALHETALALIDRRDLDGVLGTIVRRAAALTGAPDGYVYLAEGPDELVVRVATGRFATNVGYRVRRGEGLAGRVLERGEPLAVERYRDWRGRRRDLDGMELGALAAVPLLAGPEVVGVLGLAYADERAFGEVELARLTRFGRLASLALENARLYGEAQAELDERRRAEEELQDAVARLTRSERELERTREEMVRRLSRAAEFGDVEMSGHIERMSRYCALLGRRLGFDEHRCELLRMASGLHDVGKIAIPDAVLGKEGLLTRDERALVERHADVGRQLLGGSGSPVLELAASIAATHHEHVDGGGYPNGLAGEEIPIEGRIAAVADVFDALTSDRSYRPAYSVEEALAIMEDRRGTHLDPLLLDLFRESLAEVLAIRKQFGGARPEESAAPVPAARAPAAERRKRSRGPRRLPGAADTLPLEPLAAACADAPAIVAGASGDREAVDLVLGRLAGAVGPDLLPSVYVRDQDRLWCVAQRHYDQVRDGFALDQGVMARAVRTGRTQYLPDVRDDPDFIAATVDLRSELALPIGVGAPAAGALNVETRVRVVPREAIALLAGVAEALAPVVERLRADIGLDLHALARRLVYASSLRGIDAIAEFATRTLGRLLDLESAQLNVGGDGRTGALASFWRRPDSELEPLAQAELGQIAGLAGGGDVPYTVLDLALSGDPKLVAGRRWLLWLPLSIAGNPVGVLVGRASRPVSFERDKVEATMLFAQHAGALIDAAQALRREQRAAVTDALTGLLNRRGFEERLQEELRRADRAARPLSLVFADCDDLKGVNDRGGHELGDAVLQAVAACLKRHKRTGDVAARLGGDEFALILPEADGEEAMRVAERVRRSLARRRDRKGGHVTITLGVAAYPFDGETPAALMRSADRALLRAKDRGKNRALAFAAA